MNICIYGASSNDISEIYLKKTEELGEILARHGHGLVFGAGDNGVMGAAARGVKRGGGKIVGVVPSFFNVDGIIYPQCDELIRPETMRERKQIMEDRADAFITAPGGIGTFEEFFEILTLKQLGRHNKPIVLYNLNGYYDGVVNLIEQAISQGFMREVCRQLCHVLDDPDEILNYLENYHEEKIDILHMKNI